MHGPELRLILALLAASCAGAAAITIPACARQVCPDWGEPERFVLAPDADVVAALWDDWDGSRYLVARGGIVIELDHGERRHHASDVELHGVALTEELLIAVGEGGRVVATPRGDAYWQAVDVGTTADLWAVVTLHGQVDRTVIVGDGVMLVYDPAAFTWREVAPPSGGWGDLRSIDLDENFLIIAVGRAGAVWTAMEVEGPWTREDPGTDADLTALSGRRAGGTDGVLIERQDDGTWRRVDLVTSADVVALRRDHTLTRDGHLFEGDSSTPVAALTPGLRVLLPDGDYHEELIALGDVGTHQRVPNRCEVSE